LQLALFVNRRACSLLRKPQIVDLLILKNNSPPFLRVSA
jgi:hypothetical protein